MTPSDLSDSLRDYLPRHEEAERLIHLTVDRLPSAIFRPEYDQYLDEVAGALGTYLGSLWARSMPPVDREISLRLTPVDIVEQSVPEATEREQILQRAEALIGELPSSRDREALARDLRLLRDSWRQPRAKALARRLRRTVIPFREAEARREALGRSVHRLSLPLGMFSKELPRYLSYLRQSGLHFPPAAFGWLPEEGRWAASDWDGLEEMTALLRQEPTVERLAKAIALPSSRSTAGPRGTTTEATEQRVDRTGKHVASLIVGRRPGRITELDEMLLLRHRRMMESVTTVQMPEREARRAGEAGENRHGVTSPKDAPLDSDSPLLLVLDTSGSMRGEPEQVAKALILGLVRHALPGRRPVWIESFSTAPRSFYLDPKLPRLEALPAHLDESFRNGGAAVPALREALRRGLAEGWNRADIVFVTDSREARLSPGTEEQLEELRRRGNFILHGLAVNELPMANPGNFFAFTWHYASSYTIRPGIASEQFRQL